MLPAKSSGASVAGEAHPRRRACAFGKRGQGEVETGRRQNLVANREAPTAAPEEKRSTPGQRRSGKPAEAARARRASSRSFPTASTTRTARRDPFISPVVSHAGGSGCSTGKKCLEIGTINLRGVVHQRKRFHRGGQQRLNKAYFLRENDPVFNGYVVKITGDSIVFQETLQDRLGKTFTREVVKKITTPAV
jgi:hypothetical protein